jgi:hypothetical protein
MVIRRVLIEKGSLSDGTQIDVSGVEMPENQVRVTINNDELNVVGLADVRKEGGHIFADIEFFKNPERYGSFFPAIKIQVIERSESTIHRSRMLGFSVGGTVNQDITIDSIENQINKNLRE